MKTITSAIFLAMLFPMTHVRGQQQFSDINVSDTATINLLNVSGLTTLEGNTAVGPSSADNISDFGASLWVEGPSSIYDVNYFGQQILAVTSQDSREATGSCPLGFLFKLVLDDSGDVVPAFLANQVGWGPVPLDLNTDDYGGGNATRARNGGDARLGWRFDV